MSGALSLEPNCSMGLGGASQSNKPPILKETEFAYFSSCSSILQKYTTSHENDYRPKLTIGTDKAYISETVSFSQKEMRLKDSLRLEKFATHGIQIQVNCPGK
jgi:hypothetical protein